MIGYLSVSKRMSIVYTIFSINEFKKSKERFVVPFLYNRDSFFSFSDDIDLKIKDTIRRQIISSLYIPMNSIMVRINNFPKLKYVDDFSSFKRLEIAESILEEL